MNDTRTMDQLLADSRDALAWMRSQRPANDVVLDEKAKELMQSDAEVRQLHQAAGFGPAFSLALTKASEQLGLPTHTPQGA